MAYPNHYTFGRINRNLKVNYHVDLPMLLLQVVINGMRGLGRW